VSIRTEVLGASLTEGFEFLSDLKCHARTVRSMLLGDSAQWMRKLSKGCDNGEFLNACSCAPLDRGNAGGPRRDGQVWDDDLCEFCEKPESSARLAGRHRCHVSATFKCTECRSRWSSVQARFNPEEERVLGQKCKDCQQSGDVLRWNFSDMPNGDNETDKHVRKPHRSDLCEACGSFGNCQGAFFEPFIMSSAIALLTKRCKAQWATSGDILVANAGPFSVAMLPHISSILPGQNPFAGGSSWASKGGDKGKAKGNSGQSSIGGKPGSEQGCFNCGEFGHISRDCPRGGTGGKNKSMGKGKKGKGKGGQVCHHWQAGNCSFGDRCHFLHD